MLQGRHAVLGIGTSQGIRTQWDGRSQLARPKMVVGVPYGRLPNQIDAYFSMSYAWGLFQPHIQPHEKGLRVPREHPTLPERIRRDRNLACRVGY